MERLHFETIIDAPVEIVYKKLLDPEGFRQWTAPFHPTSRFEGSWEEGSKMRFLSTEADGSIAGLICRVEKNIPNEYVSLAHYGIIHKGEEITDSEEAKSLLGAYEKYIFVQQREQTLLKIETDAFFDLKDFFTETWPKAFEIIKSICES